MTLNDHIQAYQKQLQSGSLQSAYRGLIEFMTNLRIHLEKKHPEDFIGGNPYFGYLDWTYFPFTPKALKAKKLKIVIILDHEQLRFEAWLVGQNKQLQKSYWELLKHKAWNKLPLTNSPKDAIIQEILAERPDFDKQSALISEIEAKVMRFMDMVNEIGDFDLYTNHS
ncbi:MAG: hypothetical protein AAFX87_08255 [Bacteroidota bacterium]